MHIVLSSILCVYYNFDHILSKYCLIAAIIIICIFSSFLCWFIKIKYCDFITVQCCVIKVKSKLACETMKTTARMNIMSVGHRTLSFSFVVRGKCNVIRALLGHYIVRKSSKVSICIHTDEIILPRLSVSQEPPTTASCVGANNFAPLVHKWTFLGKIKN